MNPRGSVNPQGGAPPLLLPKTQDIKAGGKESETAVVTAHRTDGYGTGGKSPYNLQTWQTRPKNALFFNSKDLTAAPLTVSEAAVRR